MQFRGILITNNFWFYSWIMHKPVDLLSNEKERSVTDIYVFFTFNLTPQRLRVLISNLNAAASSFHIIDCMPDPLSQQTDTPAWIKAFLQNCVQPRLNTKWS